MKRPEAAPGVYARESSEFDHSQRQYATGQSKARLAYAVLVLLPLSVLLFAPAAQGAIHCPPRPGDGAVLNGDVNGDGKRDWHFPGSDQKDAGGNEVITYCLAKPANRFHVVYVDAATGKKHTVGGCFFPRGKNRRSKEKYLAGPKKGQWKTVDWHNWDPDTGADWHFEFDTATKQLKKKKTQGEVAVTQRDDFYYAVYHYDVVATETEYAPVDAEVLRFHARPLDTACAANGCSGVSSPNVLVSSVSTSPGMWEFQMKTPMFGGDGSAEAPFEGINVKVKPGNSIHVAASGIRDAWVEGTAAAPENGAWRVADYDSNGVRFEATTHADLLPGFLLTGLSLESSVEVTGSVEWATVGDDIRYDGKIAGPGFIGPGDVKPAPIDVDVAPADSFPLIQETPIPSSESVRAGSLEALSVPLTMDR